MPFKIIGRRMFESVEYFLSLIYNLIARKKVDEVGFVWFVVARISSFVGCLNG